MYRSPKLECNTIDRFNHFILFVPNISCRGINTKDCCDWVILLFTTTVSIIRESGDISISTNSTWIVWDLSRSAFFVLGQKSRSKFLSNVYIQIFVQNISSSEFWCIPHRCTVVRDGLWAVETIGETSGNACNHEKSFTPNAQIRNGSLTGHNL